MKHLYGTTHIVAVRRQMVNKIIAPVCTDYLYLSAPYLRSRKILKY